MSSEVFDFLSKVFLLILGWLFGLLSPAIVDLNRKMREAAETKKVLKVELSELQYRLVVSAIHLDMKYGLPDREFISLSKKINDGYSGLNKKDSITKLIDDLNASTDDDLKKRFDASKVVGGASLLKKHITPLLDARINSLVWVGDSYRKHLLELKTNLSMMYETIDDARCYYNLTFQNLSNENHESASFQVIESYKNYSSRAKLIVKIIEMIL